MGYRSTLTVTNSSSFSIRSLVTDTTCMYSHGDGDSYLNYFNDLVLAPGETSGEKTIEAKASGDCAFSNSSFKLEFRRDVDGKVETFSMKFTDVSNRHWTQPDGNSWICLSVDNSGHKGVITITIVDS